MAAKNPHNGHRKRVKEEFLKNGLDNLPAHRVLEILLFYAIPQKDTNELAHRLEDRFGSLARVLDAPYEELLTVNGVGDNTAVLLRLISSMARRYYLDKASAAPLKDPMQAIGEWLKAWYVGRTEEVLILISLDNNLSILHVDEIKTGVADDVQIQFRDLARKALGFNATNAILAHNHPGGMAHPSRADRETTRTLHRRFQEVGINLLDHFIVAGDEYVSMRECGGFIGIE